MSSKSVDFYFDFGSPAAYLAWTQLPELCVDAGAELVHKPMLLGGVYKATGNQSPIAIPAKARYIRADYQRCARRWGVPFQLNPHFPINTLVLMRGACALQMDAGGERFADYCAAVYRAIWVEQKDMNDPAVVGGVLQATGLDPAAWKARTGDAEVKDRLRANTDEAVARGVFGAPTMFVGEQMFWGQDRLGFVREALDD